jgi:hypothetical protein
MTAFNNKGPWLMLKWNWMYHIFWITRRKESHHWSLIYDVTPSFPLYIINSTANMTSHISTAYSGYIQIQGTRRILSIYQKFNISEISNILAVYRNFTTTSVLNVNIWFHIIFHCSYKFKCCVQWQRFSFSRSSHSR